MMSLAVDTSLKEMCSEMHGKESAKEEFTNGYSSHNESSHNKHSNESKAIESEQINDEGVVSLAQQFLKLRLPFDCEILDVACGTGVVAEECRNAGYSQIDGLDPSQAYLDAGVARGLFRRAYKEFIDPDQKTSIPDESYDALLCCAGFFQGLISPKALPELVRLARPGGIIAWNIAAGYEHFDKDYARFDELVMDLVRQRRWEFAAPVVSHEQMCFTDCGAAYLRGFTTLGGIQCQGFTYIMRKL